MAPRYFNLWAKVAASKPSSFWLKQAKADVEPRSGASFGAAVQLSVGSRRYPPCATQESSSFQETEIFI